MILDTTNPDVDQGPETGSDPGLGWRFPHSEVKVRRGGIRDIGTKKLQIYANFSSIRRETNHGYQPTVYRYIPLAPQTPYTSHTLLPNIKRSFRRQGSESAETPSRESFPSSYAHPEDLPS